MPSKKERQRLKAKREAWRKIKTMPTTQAEWQKEYDAYSKMYDRASANTKMQEKLSFAWFKTMYEVRFDEADGNVSSFLVKTQKRVPTQSQITSIKENLRKVLTEYPKESKEILSLLKDLEGKGFDSGKHLSWQKYGYDLIDAINMYLPLNAVKQIFGDSPTAN